MVKFKDLEYPQNIVSLHVQRRNMFWISIEKSIEVAVWCFPFFFFKSNFPYRFARSSRWIVMPTKKLMDDKERHRQKNKNKQQLVDELNPLLKLKGNTDGIFPSKENNERKKFVCSLASAVASEKDLYPIRGQAWQKGDDRGSVALWGLSATHKSPTWKSYKDWHWLWHRATSPTSRLCGNEGKQTRW